MAPQIPPMSGEWQIDYHFGDALYKIQIENYSGQKIAGYSLSIGGVPEKNNSFLLKDDPSVHTVTVAIVSAKDQI